MKKVLEPPKDLLNVLSSSAVRLQQERYSACLPYLQVCVKFYLRGDLLLSSSEISFDWLPLVYVQLCLHRSMLEKRATRFSMRLYSLLGITWYAWIASSLTGPHASLFRYIAVNHKGNGVLESHVYATDVPAVEFDITFTLINFENEEANIIYTGIQNAFL